MPRPIGDASARISTRSGKMTTSNSRSSGPQAEGDQQARNGLAEQPERFVKRSKRIPHRAVGGRRLGPRALLRLGFGLLRLDGGGCCFFLPELRDLEGPPLPLDLADGDVEREPFELHDRIGQPHQLKMPPDDAARLGVDLAAAVRRVAGKPGDGTVDDRPVIDRDHLRGSENLRGAAACAVDRVEFLRLLAGAIM